MRGLVAQFRFVEQHAGEERAQRERNAEQHRRAERHAQRDRQHRQREQFALTGTGNAFEDPRNDPAADHQHHRHEQAQLHEGPADVGQHAADAVGFLGGLGAEYTGQHRHHHQRQHTGQVFHDQPADRDLAAHGFQQAAFLHGPKQHHGAGGGQRETEDDTVQGRPAHQPGHAPAEQGGHRDLADGAGNGDRLARHQVLQREVQANAEHQQHHAQFGQLVGQRLVGDEAGGERAYTDASNQITDQRRQAQLVGQRAEDEGEPQANGHDVDQVGVMVHRLSQKSGGCPDFHR
ncbi:hypothetical protein G6F35_013970 [Rhizopus arrhizus]|nr:hypothetical protein G6F35_013970 [Rhizopus arrhizus]